MKILIQNSAVGTFINYTPYVVDGSVEINDSINVPSLINFALEPIDKTFVSPKVGAYVKIVSEIYGVSGGYGSGKILATGFVTTEPDRQYLGVDHNVPQFKFQHYQYSIKVTSDEWILNCDTVPYIPAFVNQTDSQILATIANAINPIFDTTSFMASGTLVPYFQYDPAQTWSDIAKYFADANRYHYKVIDRKIIYQPFGDTPLGITYDEATQTKGDISPFELKTSVLTVPPVNDSTVIGDVEPQANWKNYFIGDGFSANFLMRHPVFEGTSADLLSDDWTESSFTKGTWVVNDPTNVFALTDSGGQAVGALNVTQLGFPGVYTPKNLATFVQAQNGLELGGGLNLQHGQFTFNNACEGIVGGIYPTSEFLPGSCLAGFGFTGQQAFSSISITSVQRNANSSLINVTAVSVPLALQPGHVLVGGGFTTATFLNGTKVSVHAINGNIIQLIGIAVYGPAYGPTADTGTLTGTVNDVLVTASGTAGVVIQPIVNGAFLGNDDISFASTFGTPTQYTTAVGSQGNAQWTTTANNAVQHLNADASILPLSIVLDNSQNPQVISSVSVAPNGDDDFIGFAFNFQDQGHFYLIDWKMATQNDPNYGLAPVGMRVKKVSTSSTLDQINLWAGNGAVTVLASNSIPWAYGVSYTFKFNFNSTGFVITVFQGTSVIATFNIADTTYTVGQFGFYCFSQEQVSFPNIHVSIGSKKVISQINHQYLLQTWIGANTQSRYTRPFTNLTRTATYGAQDLAAAGTISFVVTDYNIGDYVLEQQNPLFGLFPAVAPVVTKNTIFDITLPPFGLYCLMNARNLNLSCNYTDLSLPPQGYLTVQSLTGASGGNNPWLPSQLSQPIHYQLGFGLANQTAQISLQGEVYELSFYSDNIPSVGARIQFQSWAAGQSIARVRDTINVAQSAVVSGDNGVRAAITTNIQPLPRTSDECEAAAAAYIRDREFPQFQGNYTQTVVPRVDESFISLSMYNYPRTGQYLYVNAPFRGISGQTFYVNQVSIKVKELKQEVMDIGVSFGPDLYLEKLLPPFLERNQNILTPTQTVATPDYVVIQDVLNAFLPTLDAAEITSITNSVTGNYVTVEAGVTLTASSQVEVRYVDGGWGIANQGRVGLFNAEIFTLPRTIRDQTWYLRLLDNTGRFSRFSTALRVVYPLVPTPPGLVQADISKAVFAYTGDVRDVYGIELRVAPVSGVVYFDTPNSAIDNVAAFNRTAVNPSASTKHNVLAVYAAPNTSATFPYAFDFQPGDVLIAQCPGDSSFKGIQIVTERIPSSQAAPPVFPTHVTLNGADAYFYLNLQSDNGFERLYPLSAGSAVSSFKKLTSLKFNSHLGQSGDPSVQPMQVDVYDSSGLFHGRQVVWTGATQGYDMVVSGSLFFPAGGIYTMNVTHDDAFIFGIQGATRISGLMNDPHFSHTQTAMLGLPILGMNNVNGFYPNEAYVFSVPASGNYMFEVDFDQWIHAQTLQIQVNGIDILPTPTNIGTGGSIGNSWQIGMFDYGQPTPDTAGNSAIGSTSNVGTLQLLTRPASALTLTTGVINANYTGVCRLGTGSAHGFVVGDTVIVGCGWVNWTSPIPTPPQSGTVFCGQQVVTNVPDSTHFDFVLSQFANQSQLAFGSWEQMAAASGVISQSLVGYCGKMPTPQTFATASGVILQRPVFAPSDLIIDFTQPDLAKKLELIQLLSSSNRVGGLTAYFYNLTWDYSLGTEVPAFQVPSITDVYIDSNTQTINWRVNSGVPRGYRVTVADPSSGLVYNTFTVDNPLNSQPLTQFKMLSQDFLNTRVVSVVPFDTLGDGIQTQVVAGGFGQGGGVATSWGYAVHFQQNALTVTGQIIGRVIYDQPVQYYQNFLPSQAWMDLTPDRTHVLSIQKFSLLDGTQDDGEEVGCIVFQPNSHVGTFNSGPDGVAFNTGEVLKVIQSAYNSNGQGMAITMSSLLNPAATQVPTSSGSPTVPPISGSEDMLNWVLNSDSANSHYHDANNPATNPIYTYYAPGDNKFWHLKGKAGNPWDLNLVDNTYLYLWITENGDQHAWSNPQAYKRNNVSHGNPLPQGFPYIPRIFNSAGSAVTIDSAAPNPVIRTLNCEADGQPVIQLGPVRCITRPAEIVAWGRSVGTQNTITVEYYYGGGATPYKQRERFHLVKNTGQVQWDYGFSSTGIGGTYTISNMSQFLDKVSGGGVTPNFPCSSGPPAWWIP